MKTETMPKFAVLVLLAILSITIVQSAICNVQPVPISFRLLAVEGAWAENTAKQSAQYLIRKLVQYPNWNNETDNAYIELLSRYSRSECIEEAKTYWKCNSTKSIVLNEITNFLGSADPNELVIFYCITEGGQSRLFLDQEITAAELDSCLRGTVCVILDSCYSGSWTNDGQGSSFSNNKIVLCSSRSNQKSWGPALPYSGGFFTGNETIPFYNGTHLPIGLISATIAGKYVNGCLSVMECFAYAKDSIEQHYPVGHPLVQNPVAFNGLSFDPPLVQLNPPVTKFSYFPLSLKVNQSVLFNASTSNGSIVGYG